MAHTKEQLMKKSVEALINLVITTEEKYEKMKQKYDAQRKVSASDKLREEAKALRAKVKKYESMVEKVNKL